jgi:hypothetical protein
MQARRGSKAGWRKARPWCTWPVHDEMTPNPKLLRDDRLATDGIRAPGRQPPAQHCHADGSLGLLASKAAGLRPRSDQRLVTAHCRFYQGALAVVVRNLPGQAALVCNHRQMTIALRRWARFPAGDGRRAWWACAQLMDPAGEPGNGQVDWDSTIAAGKSGLAWTETELSHTGTRLLLKWATNVSGLTTIKRHRSRHRIEGRLCFAAGFDRPAPTTK